MNSLTYVLCLILCAASVCHLTVSLDHFRNPTEERYSVVIVGAGVSGVSAGVSLLQAGVKDVVILEASDRIGGRIHTVQFGGRTLDRGAEFVHGEKGNTVYQLLKPYDLLTSYSLVEKDEDFLIVDTSGATYDPTDIRKWFRRAYEILGEESAKQFNGSEAEYLAPRLNREFKREHVPKIIQEIVWYLVTQSEGIENASENLEELGARGTSQFMSQGDYEQKFKTVGYEILFDVLTKIFPNPKEELSLRNKTLLGKVVTRIVRGDGSAQVTCSDGSTYLADHVIVTSSLGVLKKHAADMFQPELPRYKMAAIESLGFGTVDKIFLLFPNRWWPRNITTLDLVFTNRELKKFVAGSTHGHWTAFNTGFQPVMTDDLMLCVWFYGTSARSMERLSEEQVVDGLMELLDYFIGDTFNISRPVSILRSGWYSNKFTKGSYSYSTVTSDNLGISHSDLARPVYDHQGKPVLLFAGEATSSHHFSTVHGALDSGHRAAKTITNHMKKTIGATNGF